MTSFKTVPNHSHKVRFPWEVVNSQYLSTNLDSILDQALQNTSEYLSQFRFDTAYTTKLETAFGTDFNRSVANSIFDKLAEGDFSDIPNIEIVNRNDINGANGAFAVATGKIYLSQEFITANAQNLNAIVSVLLEEYGHYVDARINTKDAAGDEGDIFARLLQGKSLSEQELAVLRAEDDTATVKLNGQVVEIEQNSLQVTFYENTMYGGNSLSLAPGNYNQTDFGSLGNDKLSSLKIPEGLSVRLYADHYYQGKYKDYTSGNIEDVKDFNDLTSSIQIIKGPSIETFRDTNYGGNSFRFAPGNYNQTDLGSLGYDALSSLKIPEGLSVRLYEYNSFLGKYKDYTSGNIEDVKDFNDLTSSIQIIQGPSIEIFQHDNYGGNSFRLAPGKYNNIDLGSVGNDQLSSLKVPRGLTVILYEYGDFQGKQKVFNSGDYSSVGGDFNDQTSSIEVLPPAEIFQHDNYGGNSFKLAPGKYNINDLGSVGNDQLSSLKVPRGLTVILYEYGDFQGKQKVFNSGDYSSVGGDFNDQTSSIEVRVLLRGESQDDTITGGSGSDILYGGAGNDTLYGEDGDDTLYGENGNDSLYGGAGNDTLYGENGNDSLYGGAGIDTFDISKSGTSYEVRLDGENQGSASSTSIKHQLFLIENVIGSNYNDNIFGDALANRLEGNGGNDVLTGNSGDDILRGGLGNDTLDGGTESDRAIETGDVNFTLSIVNIANDTNNTHQLTGLGTDTLRNIETVELQGGASNNTLDASLATVKVKLEGLEGNDTLKGGSGDDTLIGGKGNNTLWGGKGRDTFVIDRSSTSLYSGDIQIIQDFERTVDSIDIAGAELRYITFERNTVENYTLIKENGVDRAKVLGTTRIDSTDLSAFRTIYQPLPANEVGNLDQVIRKWAQNYAAYLKTTLVTDVSLTEVILTQGVVKYDPLTSISLPNSDIQVVGNYINKSNTQQTSPVFKYTAKESTTSNVTEGTSYSNTATSAMQHGWEVTAAYKFSLKAGLPAVAETTNEFSISGKVFGNYSSSGSYTNGGSKTYSNIKVAENSTETTYSYNAPAFSVTEFKAISSKTTYSGKYEMDVAIGGNVTFRLADDGNTSNGTNAQDVTVPVALILEQYNPEIFHSQNPNYQTYTLVNGQQIVYSPNLEFTVKGTIESQSIYGTQVVTNTTYDILLGGLQNYQAQAGNERLWVATGQLPLAGTVPVKITGFSDGLDKIGFANVPQIMGLGSLERWDSGTSGFIGIGTGDQRRALAELVGISATALDASDFIFNTTGTAIF
jgi:Ca2+-binding RTX toxin-like protein